MGSNLALIGGVFDERRVKRGKVKRGAQGVPRAIRDDTLWKMEAYRLALFLSDLGSHDETKLAKDRRPSGSRTRSIARSAKSAATSRKATRAAQGRIVLTSMSTPWLHPRIARLVLQGPARSGAETIEPTHRALLDPDTFAAPHDLARALHQSAHHPKLSARHVSLITFHCGCWEGHVQACSINQEPQSHSVFYCSA